MDEKKDIEELIKVILAQSSERLEQDLSDFESLHSKLTKHQVLKTFNDYLRILFIHKYTISYPLIQRYGKFSKQGRAGSDFEVAFYLNRMCSNIKDTSVTVNL
ncbi:MAG: hypothetical protein LIO93_06465 [Bacteroidales bacterium]|nr:hypothetical protein [Bacteroidales bacterium]